MMLQLKPVYTSDFFRIEADHAAGLVRTEWLRGVNDAEFFEAAARLNEFLLAAKPENYLAHAKNLGGLSTKIKDWLAGSFYKQLSQLHIKQMARIMPESLFSKLALESVVTRAGALDTIRFPIKSFLSEEEALAWLYANP